MIFAGGQFNPQPAQAQVFQPARTPPVVASAVRTVSAAQQQYVDPFAAIWRSVVAGATPQPIPLVIGQPQSDPSQLAARLFPAAAPAVIPNPVALFLSAAPQPDTTQPSSIFASVRTPPAAVSGDLAKFVQGAPEQVDLGIEGWQRAPSLRATGEAARFISTLPQRDTNGVSQVFQSVRTPPAAVSGDLAAFVRAAPQHDLTPGSRIFPSVRTPPVAATGPVPTFLAVAPQYDLYRASTIWKSVRAQGPGLSSEFRFGLHAVAIHNAESVKSAVWESARTPPAPTPGPVPATILALEVHQKHGQSNIWKSVTAAPVVSYALTPLYAAPQRVDLTLQGSIFRPTPGRQGAVPPMQRASQDDPSQIAASVFIASLTQPLQFGKVPPTILAGQPQESASYRQIDARLFSPLEFGIPAPPVVIDDQPSGGWPRPGRIPRREREERDRESQLARAAQEAVERAMEAAATLPPTSAQQPDLAAPAAPAPDTIAKAEQALTAEAEALARIAEPEFTDAQMQELKALIHLELQKQDNDALLLILMAAVLR